MVAGGCWWIAVACASFSKAYSLGGCGFMACWLRGLTVAHCYFYSGESCVGNGAFVLALLYAVLHVWVSLISKL